MIPAKSQEQLFREYLMARTRIDPKEFGIPLSYIEYRDQMIEELNVRYRGQITIDELCLHPREALLFCDHVRAKFGYHLVPDDVILRPIMLERKASKGGKRKKPA